MTDRFQRARLADYLGDHVVYRNLEPADDRLQGLKQIWPEIGMESYRIPRKVEPEYADAILLILAQAQARRGEAEPLRCLLYIGDTFLLDGTAYRNLRSNSGVPGRAFICSEDMQAEPRIERSDDLYAANRWATIADFLSEVQKERLPLDAQTVAIIDLDKTALGARGRNHRAVDSARVDGVRRAVEEAVGSDFDAESFRVVYDELNKPDYHHFTADNQDILAYVCLMVAGGVYDYASLRDDVSQGRMSSFDRFLAACDKALARSNHYPTALHLVHAEVQGNHQRGDPTPFKSFRRREYLTTIARMDFMPDSTPLDQLLAEEITLTREVAEAALWLGERGVLCFGISDKPDEASLPTPEQAESGCLALHRKLMKLTGTELWLADL